MLAKGRRRASTIARWFKSVGGRLAFALGLHRIVLRKQGVVVAFHRFCEEGEADPIGTTPGDFEKFLAFFSRHFDVVSLGSLVSAVESGAPVGNKLAISFDDGYRDNATIAAPVLQRFGMSACFFVASSFIATESVAPWDVARKQGSGWMTWEQVRMLREAGHEIGSHTSTHIDLGSVGVAEARANVAQGIRTLSAQLGEPVTLFAYPFGRISNLSHENRTVIRELGVRCIMSAHGGTIRNGDDPFDLNRIPISNWFTSPYQFGFELIVGKLRKEKPVRRGGPATHAGVDDYAE